MTYNELKNALIAAGVGSPDECGFEAKLLAERFGGIKAAELPFRRGEDMTCPALAEALARRIRREPLQYILGEWEFYGLGFKVTPACLIPRADTEITVSKAIKMLPVGARFADLGTGSGAIAVSVLKNRPDVTAVAVDISSAALEVARLNAAQHGTDGRIGFIHADMLADDFFDSLPHPLDAIISNPPYIPKSDLLPGAVQPELNFEPRGALDGGDDGLDFYRSLIPRAAETGVLTDGGFVLFEVGAGEACAVARMGADAGFSSEILCDLGGIERTVILSRR